MQNLRNSFPEKSQEELEIIAKKFYHHLSDIFVEAIKTLVISKNEANLRCVINNNAKSLFDRYNEESKSIIVVMGHFGNWEWGGNTFSLNCNQQLYVIYHPLTNSFFNRLICETRKRFGTQLIAMKDTYKDLLSLKNEVTATAFIADQSPAPESAHWMKFLNQDTPVFKGAEKIARKLNYPVVYVSVKKIKRGYYELFAETLFENSTDTIDGQITDCHTKRLEQDIVNNPEFWLWSHKRWKHKKV